MIYERTSSIERDEGAAPGVISGIVVTDGEASDGHILNINGIKIPDKPPLLFGHDDWTGTGNLGSWTDFSKYSTGKKLGESGVRGTAEIELDGSGSQLAWREDVNHMIEKGHIGAFSIRWEEVGEPQRRVNLSSDHPAFIDEKKATGRQRWGLYFEKSRMLENSVVTLGADPAALIGRMQESEGDTRGYWRKVINHAMEEVQSAAGDLVGVQVNGEIVYVERAVYEAMLEESNLRLQLALDLHEQRAPEVIPFIQNTDGLGNEALTFSVRYVNEDGEEIQPTPDQGSKTRSEGEHSEEREDPEETEEANEEEPEQEQKSAPLPDITPRDVQRMLREKLANARKELTEERREFLKRASGKVGT